MAKAKHSKETLASDINILSKYCSEEWRPVINMYRTVSEFGAKERIFTEGDEVKGIYFIEKGKIKVVSSYGKNLERILRLAGEGKVFGHRGLTSKQYPISAITLTDSTVSFIPLDIYNKLLKSNPEFSRYMINFLTDQLLESEMRMKKMIHLDVRQKIADIVVMLINAFGFDKEDKNKLSYTLSRYDFANIAGTTYETVIRSMAFLQKKGYIKLDGKNIRVINQDGLRKFSQN